MPASTGGWIGSGSRNRRRSRLSQRKRGEELKSILKNRNDNSCMRTSESQGCDEDGSKEYYMGDSSPVDTASMHRRKKRISRKSKSRSVREKVRRSFMEKKHRNHGSSRVTFKCLTRRRPSRRTDVWWDANGRSRDVMGRFVRTNKHSKDDYKSVN